MPSLPMSAARASACCILLLAAFSRPVLSAAPTEKVMEYCQDVDNSFDNSAFNGLPVVQGVLGRLGNGVNQIVSGKVPTKVRDSINVSVIEAPKHGTVERDAHPSNSYFWHYKPDQGYVGQDRVVFFAEFRGRHFKIIANLLVHEVVDEYAKPRACELVFEKREGSH